MTEQELKERTKQFATRVIALVDALPRTIAGRAIANQIVRSATSVAANYRAACRARSSAEFIAKLAIVEEESDESLFWLELIADTRLLPASRLGPLMDEANAITAIIVRSIKTVRRNHARAADNPKPKTQNPKLR